MKADESPAKVDNVALRRCLPAQQAPCAHNHLRPKIYVPPGGRASVLDYGSPLPLFLRAPGSSG
jgi:hypothetical protein